MHIHLLACQSNNVFRASLHAERAALAPVGIYNNSTSNFSHCPYVFNMWQNHKRHSPVQSWRKKSATWFFLMDYIYPYSRSQGYSQPSVLPLPQATEGQALLPHYNSRWHASSRRAAGTRYRACNTLLPSLSVILFFACGKRVLHERAYRHGTHSTRNRRYE